MRTRSRRALVAALALIGTAVPGAWDETPFRLTWGPENATVLSRNCYMRLGLLVCLANMPEFSLQAVPRREHAKA